VKIQGATYKINVIIRPGAEEFLVRAGELYEVVVFTASLAEYAEPLVRILDPTNVVSGLLYRQHCTPLNGIYVKDMTLLGRDVKDIILVDNSPNSFLFQPENAYHIKNFFDDKTDRELISLMNFLEEIANVDDVRPIEDWRVKHSQQPSQSQKSKKFKKIKQDSVDLELSEIEIQDQATKASPAVRDDEKEAKETYKESNLDREERTYNIETEPDLRKDEREEEYVPQSAKTSRLEKKYVSFYGRAAPLTERLANDRLLVQQFDSIVDLELPSPKESDGLINYREAGAYFENNSNETESEKKKAQLNKPKVPSLSGAPVFNKANPKSNVVTVENPTIEGHKVEDVRMLTNFANLNSPLGRQAKIHFDKTKVSVKN
jgi:Dullard-like phosphatase family protein